MEMHEDDQKMDAEFSQSLQIMQIILIALVGGVGAYSIVVGMTFQRAVFAESLESVATIALGMAAFSIIGRLIVPGMIGSMTEKNSLAEFIALYQVRMIVGLAILEAAAFFNLVAFQLEHHWLSLAATGVLVIFMLANWPTRSKIQSWVRTQREMATLR